MLYIPVLFNLKKNGIKSFDNDCRIIYCRRRVKLLLKLQRINFISKLWIVEVVIGEIVSIEIGPKIFNWINVTLKVKERYIEFYFLLDLLCESLPCAVIIKDRIVVVQEIWRLTNSYVGTYVSYSSPEVIIIRSTNVISLSLHVVPGHPKV